MPLYRTPGQYGGVPSPGADLVILQHEFVAAAEQSSVIVADASTILNVYRDGQALISGASWDYTTSPSGSGIEITFSAPLIEGENMKVDYQA